jgi:hypothetical protein
VKNTARTLHGKALSSLRTAMTSFNSPHDDGRVTSVLLHLQHAFEMLLKAALSQGGAKVFDKHTGRSIGFEAAVNQARQLPSLKLTEDEAALLRAIDTLRDDEQHWFNDVAEGLLFLYARSAVTLFDELLTRAFGQKLADHLPTRVLPVSTEAPQDFLTLVDSEYANISELLRPGRRARYEARAKIRTLLALEAHVSEDVRVSDSDVNRVAKGIKDGKTRDQVFPRLGSVGAEISGDGVTVKVKIVKRDDALPVRLVKADDEVDAAAVREVDVQAKFHWTSSKLAGKLGLSTLRAAVLREHLGIDSDPACTRTIPHNRSLLVYYSDNALTRMRTAAESLDLDAIWESHGKVKRSKPRPACMQPGCAVAQVQQTAS